MNETGQNGISHRPAALGNQPAAAPFGIPAEGVFGTQVKFKNEEGGMFVGVPVHLTRQAVVFELYCPGKFTQLSKRVREFKINLYGGEVYSGEAMIRNLIDAGSKVVCEAQLNETD